MNTETTLVPLNVFLRQRREKLNLKQADIAEQLRVTPVTVGHWEGGQRRIMIDKLPRLARILEVDARTLCGMALRDFHPAVYAVLFQCETAPQPAAFAAAAVKPS